MYQVFIITKKELRVAFRNKQIIITGILISVLLLIAGAGGFLNYKMQKDEVAVAQKEKRQQWLEQGNKHPHIAAHFGTFVFKPKTALSFFDFGVDSYTGSSIYLEAHYQHEFMFRPAQDFGAMIRFGELSIALVLQILIPLLIIFLAFSSFTGEREHGTLRILLSQGVPLRAIIQGKILAYNIVVFSLLLPTLTLLFVGIFMPFEIEFTTEVFLRLIILVLSYILYFFIFIVLAVWISSKSVNSGKSLLTLLSIWIVLTIILPKTTASIASEAYPLPSLNAYQQQIKNDINSRIERNPLKDEVIVHLTRQLLTEYKVREVSQLPINYEAACAQAYEDFGNRIHDKHTLGLQEVLVKQNRVSKYLSLLDPYLAVRNISMSLSATDFATYTDFQTSAENYRRKMVRMMNMDYRDHSKTGEFYEYKASRSLWEAVPDFNYKTPDIIFPLENCLFEIIALLAWAVSAFLLVSFSFNKMIL
ncbi:DUF3526 domain-containing protein [Desertivirga brevis]|uniref:DUF3526 domain-containing protein n=1 Tax=Desertivirga brevis TaxID=2810310 RepID=UPI001A97B20C|nr:DUF3526 domain-containing protein [Pedobacter sp. SYSU D00873]